MKSKILGIILFFLIPTLSFAQKDTCKVGLYINCLYDFKLDQNSYKADFWMWMNYSNSKLDFKDNQDITNAKISEFTHYSVENNKTSNWAAQKCKAEIMQQWDVTNYPFDKQKLRIEIEDAENDSTQMIYVADTINSKLDPCFASEEWDIVKFTIKDELRTYATNYGNPLLKGTSTYPQVVVEIDIKRNHSWLLLLKLLTGAYVAFFISALVFFVSSVNQDSRFALCVGGLFAAIGNKYITESVVPTSNSYTLMDNVHNLTFGYILLVIVICIISLKLFESDDENKIALSHKIDRISFWVVLSSYVLLNAAIVAFAVFK